MPHLPLTAIDSVNLPPESYLWIQDGLTLAQGFLWCIAYILYIRQGEKDKSYGMPLLSMCANIAWELIYGTIHPPGMAELASFLPFFIIDLVIVRITLKYGPQEWKHAPLVQKYFGTIILFGCLWMFSAFYLHAEGFTDFTEASYWSGYTCQLIVSWSAIAQLVSRGHTRGHTMTIWWCRWIGTLCATGVFHWRVYNYPKNYGYVNTPMARFLFIAPEVADLAYPFVFRYVQKLERERVKGK